MKQQRKIARCSEWGSSAPTQTAVRAYPAYRDKRCSAAGTFTNPSKNRGRFQNGPNYPCLITFSSRPTSEKRWSRPRGGWLVRNSPVNQIVGNEVEGF